VKKKHDKSKLVRDEESLNYTQAVILSSIEDKQEQKDLAKVLKNSREQRVREQGKLLSKYKEAPEEVKEKIRDGKLNLIDIEEATIDTQIKQVNGGTHTEFIPNFETRLTDFGYNVAKLEQQVVMFKKVFGSSNFYSKYKSLGTKEKKFLDNSIYDIRKRIKQCYNEVEFFISKIEDKKLLEEEK